MDFVAPWYISFYAGWFSNLNALEGRVFMLSYEELIADPVSALESISKYFEIPKKVAPVKAVNIIKGQQTLKNVGKSGRGKELSDEVVKKVQRLAFNYRSVDFTPIGIAPFLK